MKLKSIIALSALACTFVAHAAPLDNKESICKNTYLDEQVKNLQEGKLAIKGAIAEFEKIEKTCFSKDEVSLDKEALKVSIAQSYMMDNNKEACLKVASTFIPVDTVVKTVNPPASAANDLIELQGLQKLILQSKCDVAAMQ